jgi:hypothetical protein
MDLNKQLRERLKEKRTMLRNQSYTMSPTIKRKMDKQVSKDKREMEKDTRLTPVMKKWFMEAMASSLTIDVKTPSYILNNLDQEKLEFYKFITKYMGEVRKDVDDWKKGMMPGLDKIDTPFERDEYLQNLENEYKKKFSDYFTTPYIIYMSLMTDINVYKDLLNM